jgi:phytoene dehydrogenase-like protein
MKNAIVIGAGHNGLVTANYLAKAGMSVTVLEANSFVGGLASARPICDGYKSLGTLSDTQGFRPWIIDDLDLGRHGLSRHTKPSTLTLHGTDLEPIYVTGNELEGAIEQTDKEQFAAHRAFLGRIGKTIGRLLDQAPLDPLGPIMPLLGPLLSVRRLGADDMTEVMRIGSMCIADWMRDKFDNERIGAGICHDALMGAWCGPWSPWTALNLILSQSTRFGELTGGSPGLISALVSAAESRKVSIQTDARVSRVEVEHDQVVGVRLASGQLIEGSLVASSTDPKSTFLSLLDPRRISPSLARDIGNIRMRGTTAKLELALSAVPLDVSGQPITHLRTGDDLNRLEMAFDPVKYDQMSETPVIDMRVSTDTDGGQCPTGHAVASVTIRYAPQCLKGGWTVDARETLRTRTRILLSRVSPHIDDLIVGETLLTPTDLETSFSLSGGHLLHGEPAPDQLLFMRPTVDLSNYETPVSGLYLCGSGSHPGGGITGAPGALAARAILKKS